MNKKADAPWWTFLATAIIVIVVLIFLFIFYAGIGEGAGNSLSALSEEFSKMWR